MVAVFGRVYRLRAGEEQEMRGAAGQITFNFPLYMQRRTLLSVIAVFIFYRIAFVPAAGSTPLSITNSAPAMEGPARVRGPRGGTICIKFLHFIHQFPGCRALTSRQGYVTSPNYPSSYPNGLKCSFPIEVPEGLTLEITVEDIGVIVAIFRTSLSRRPLLYAYVLFPQLEGSPPCSLDYVEVSFVKRGEGTVHLDRMCDSSATGTLLMEGVSNAVLITFRTDGSVQDRGFVISYRGVEEDRSRGNIKGVWH